MSWVLQSFGRLVITAISISLFQPGASMASDLECSKAFKASDVLQVTRTPGEPWKHILQEGQGNMPVGRQREMKEADIPEPSVGELIQVIVETVDPNEFIAMIPENLLNVQEDRSGFNRLRRALFLVQKWQYGLNTYGKKERLPLLHYTVKANADSIKKNGIKLYSGIGAEAGFYAAFSYSFFMGIGVNASAVPDASILELKMKGSAKFVDLVEGGPYSHYEAYEWFVRNIGKVRDAFPALRAWYEKHKDQPGDTDFILEGQEIFAHLAGADIVVHEAGYGQKKISEAIIINPGAVKSVENYKPKRRRSR